MMFGGQWSGSGSAALWIRVGGSDVRGEGHGLPVLNGDVGRHGEALGVRGYRELLGVENDLSDLVDLATLVHDVCLLEHARFAGIDLNSGFEISPAIKDVEKLEKFIGGIRKYPEY